MKALAVIAFACAAFAVVPAVSHADPSCDEETQTCVTELCREVPGIPCSSPDVCFRAFWDPEDTACIPAGDEVYDLLPPSPTPSP